MIIAAATTALNGAKTVDPAVRARIAAGVQSTDTTGASGGVAFDRFGDTQNKVLTPG